MIKHTAQEWADWTGCSVRATVDRYGLLEINNSVLDDNIIAPQEWHRGEIVNPQKFGLTKHPVQDWVKWLNLPVIVSKSSDRSLVSQYTKEIIYCIFAENTQYDITEFVKEA